MALLVIGGVRIAVVVAARVEFLALHERRSLGSLLASWDEGSIFIRRCHTSRLFIRVSLVAQACVAAREKLAGPAKGPGALASTISDFDRLGVRVTVTVNVVLRQRFPS